MKQVCIIFSLFLIGCNSTPIDNVVEHSVESIYDSPEDDSLEEMIAFINYIDSAGVVEKVTDNFIELKETNEKLETTLEETKQELETTKDVLVQTQVKLEKTENIVKTIIGDDANNHSGFELLPIQK
jgi:hypothetical protein